MKKYILAIAAVLLVFSGCEKKEDHAKLQSEIQTLIELLQALPVVGDGTLQGLQFSANVDGAGFTIEFLPGEGSSLVLLVDVFDATNVLISSNHYLQKDGNQTITFKKDQRISIYGRYIGADDVSRSFPIALKANPDYKLTVNSLGNNPSIIITTNNLGETFVGPKK